MMSVSTCLTADAIEKCCTMRAVAAMKTAYGASMRTTTRRVISTMYATSPGVKRSSEAEPASIAFCISLGEARKGTW